jgi:dephospho-CoA kinase
MGKTTVAEVLRQHGLAVIDTDLLARVAVEPGQPAWEDIRTLFGVRVFDPNGFLRRDILADLVFADPDARRRLEQVLHPRIREMWRKQVQAWAAAGQERAVVVIPLLFETDAQRELDYTLCVACSDRTQTSRLLTRGWTQPQIRQRIEAQLPVSEKMARSDFVLWNEAELEVLRLQVDRVLESIDSRPGPAATVPSV